MINENRMFLLKDGMARKNEDGVRQTQYDVISEVTNEIFTKISVDLLYEDYISTHVRELLIK